MSAAQGDLDQKPSMEHGYLGPIFDDAEALSLAETYEKLSALANLQSTTEVFKKAFNHVRNFGKSLIVVTIYHTKCQEFSLISGQIDFEVVRKVREELTQANVTLKSFEIAQLINLTPANNPEGIEFAKEMIPSLSRFTDHELLSFLDVLQQLQSPSYMN